MKAEGSAQLLITCHQNVFAKAFLLSFEGHLECFALLQNLKKYLFICTKISRGTPSDVLRHARVQWNSGWKTLIYKLPLTQSTKTRNTRTGTRSTIDQ